jgi:DNA-binding response OmpR family regulator
VRGTSLKRTALIVDDKPQNLGILVDVLSRAGFRVLVAEDGAAALEQAPRAAPDVILLDIMMPGLDGYETARRLRTLPTTADVPILFVTALDQTVDRVRALAAGGVDFVTKPFRADEVLARVVSHAELCALRRRHARLRERLMSLAEVSAGVRGALAEDDELA